MLLTGNEVTVRDTSRFWINNNMPEIQLKHVVSCSTEDTTHKADNLLSSDTYRKWKAARPGEKQTSVILQFEKEEQVHSIDIGNEGSAFIEVLVGNSSASVRDQDYEVLLVTSSFMSPTESRNGTNLNRVRFFGPAQLQKSSAQEKWDRVKIVCSQPYSKNISYGLAFVKFHSPPDKNDPPTSSPKLTKLGQFRVKDESPSSAPSLQPGSLFFNRDNSAKSSTSPKVSPPSQKLSYAAAALQAGGSSHPSGQASSSSSASPQPPSKRKFEFSKERQSASAPPPAKKLSPAGSPEGKAVTPKPKASPASTSSPSMGKASPASTKSTERKQESKPKPEPKQKAKSQSAKQVPFKQTLQGVVFVLSGFQNPFRGELREKALEMGAKYRPDWTPDATHLICAFSNTPKYSQVKSAGGIIVRKEWVLDCHKRKQNISFKRYLMDGAESSSESEMEVDEESEEETNTKTPQKQERQVTPKKTPEKRDEDDEYGGSTDADEPGRDDDGSAVDTEDELQRVENESRQRKAAVGKKVKEEDPYGGSTDENTDAEAEQDHPIPELPDFLRGKHFFLYGKFPNNERRLLLRYIVAFNGGIEDYMTEKVQFVVTSEGWHDSFEDALMENSNLNFVKPAWIYAINERQKMLPYQPYTVVP
ncbi:DNA repair protein XRCC1 [Notolabrus celidotus]|uniref:DNA repair protein XRCC1 n=1 Tax=Notolabrus celidotus TaxID=1203425 RepID=UPI00148FF27D|nr:DNA repair protein XRCC1 [Notolabrus celidotus]